MPIPRLKPFEGPALLSYGFRPFFLFGSLFAAVAVLLWLPLFLGRLDLPTAFAPRDWHVHEMLYGFLPAVVTGFLLTAIPNWTGRLPLQGLPLLALVLLWLSGRLAVATSGVIGGTAAAVVDLAFLAAVIAAAAREIIAGKNWRNLRVLVAVAALWIGNAIFHAEALRHGAADIGIRLGIAAMVVMVMLIGGRIIPSFTRNWLARRGSGRMPASFDRLDAASILGGVAALLVWTALPDSRIAAALLGAAAILQATRLARWAGDRTFADRLVLVLHVAYAFVPVGFALAALAAVGFLPASAGLHVWTIGAFGLMTLAVMSRASLGHTGRALVASPLVQAVYAGVAVSLVARVCAVLHPAAAEPLLVASGLSWAMAFALFGFGSWRMLTGPRLR